jgi:hypothetical protein
VCLHNVSAKEITFATGHETATDIFTDQPLQVSTVTLEPYQFLWMKTK